jgi:hypothetical protein
MAIASGSFVMLTCLRRVSPTSDEQSEVANALPDHPNV